MKHLILITFLVALSFNSNAQEHPADLYEECGGHINYGLSTPDETEISFKPVETKQ